MTKEDLIELKKKIFKLNEEEKKERDLYLRKLALGEIQGPATGYASIDKPWLKYFSEENILPDIPKMKAYEYMVLNNFQHLERNALSFFNKKISYRELFRKIDEVARALIAIGVRKGDIVTISIANIPESVYLLYALNKIGAISNYIDPRLSAEEFKRAINKTKSKFVISLEMCAKNIEKIRNKSSVEKVVYISPIESLGLPIKILEKIKEKNGIMYDEDKIIKWAFFIKQGAFVKGNVESIYEENYPITIVHTGGTTGEPKGVVLTNECFISMAHMHKFGGFPYNETDTVLNFLPPFIAYCISNGINLPLTLGAETILVPKFDAPDFPNLIMKYSPNQVLSGPILWEYAMKSEIRDLSFMTAPISGGDSLPIELEKQINDYLSEKKCPANISQGYGMTEVSSAACYSFPNAYKLGSVGIPFVKNVISIFDYEELTEKQIGEEGEVWISTPTEMLGYYDNPVETEKVKYVDENGVSWIRTGDIGKLDNDGHIYIVGRIKRMIVRNGNKIFPTNVENLILQNNNISNCVIVGVDDPIERKVPIIHIVLSENCTKSLDEIIEYIKQIICQNLPIFNVPKKYVFRDELPLTSINKVDFKALENEQLSDEIIIDKRIINVKSKSKATI